ncbi:MAG: hypothetical protein M3Q96_02885 [Pseudomonadota bacterium]|nr:hypothetical protein [Pseudomonadota bacterium]
MKLALSLLGWATALLLAMPTTSHAQQPPAADNLALLNQRLLTLDADTRTSGLASYERLQARQAIDVLAAARSRDQGSALYVAERRVETAEIAARTEAARREIERLDRERSELLVEASRRDAELARQEAERLRTEAQIQLEEATRLRQAAEQETLLRQEAEGVLDDVAGDQAAKLKAARAREAELAKKEAELLKASGGKPAAKPKRQP